MSAIAPADRPPAAEGRSDRWEVIPIGRTAWRICDATRHHGDAERLVAYVDADDGGALEVLWLRNPCPTTSRYHAMAEILDELSAAQPIEVVRDRAAPPRSIPHFPPQA